MGANAPERVMTGNTLGQVQQLSKPLALGLAILCDVCPSLRPSNHGTDRNAKKFDPGVVLMGRMGERGSLQEAK